MDNKSNYELDGDFLQMSRDELIEELTHRIKEQRQWIMESSTERKDANATIRALEKALRHGMTTIDQATTRMDEFAQLINDATITILRWRTTSYVLGAIVICLCVVLLGFNQ